MSVSAPLGEMELTLGYDDAQLRTLCDEMRIKITWRAFHGWLRYSKQKRMARALLAEIGSVKSANKRDDELNENKEENETDANKEAGVEQLCESYLKESKKLDANICSPLLGNPKHTRLNKYQIDRIYRIVYENGIENNMRKTVIIIFFSFHFYLLIYHSNRFPFFSSISCRLVQAWPFMLGHYSFEMNETERKQRDVDAELAYDALVKQWRSLEANVRRIIEEQTTCSFSPLSQQPPKDKANPSSKQRKLAKTTASQAAISSIDTPMMNNRNKDDSGINSAGSTSSSRSFSFHERNKNEAITISSIQTDSGYPKEAATAAAVSAQKDMKTPMLTSSHMRLNDMSEKLEFEDVEELSFEKMPRCPLIVENGGQECPLTPVKPNSLDQQEREVAVTVSTVSIVGEELAQDECKLSSSDDECSPEGNDDDDDYDLPSGSSSLLSTPLNSEKLRLFAQNVYRIDKDVVRCDRNYAYFAGTDGHNLDKLKNILYTY
jgi:hypothetical protein